jgi:hypothetical protein
MKYLFLLYINRSGSTYLSSELSRSRHILVCPEAEILVNLLVKKHNIPLNQKECHKIERSCRVDRKLKYWKVKTEDAGIDWSGRLPLFFSILRSYQDKTKPEARIILFKAVDLMHYTELLIDSARDNNIQIGFLIMMRDPRGIYNSQRQTYVHYRKRWMNRNPLAMVHQWQYLYELSLRYTASPHFHFIKYEDFIVDPENCIQNILDFAGLTPGEFNFSDMADLPGRIPSDQQYMHPHIKDAPRRDSIEKWETEMKPAIIEFIGRMSAEALASLDYPQPENIQGRFSISIMKSWFRFRIMLRDYYSKLLKIRSIPE